MDLIDKYIGEANIPTIDYKKVGASDWIIYDEGTGTIQKIVKGTKKAPSSQFVSSKSAAVRADYAAKNLSWMFLKKNKGFADLIKTVKNN